jgi:hypothetical protein
MEVKERTKKQEKMMDRAAGHLKTLGEMTNACGIRAVSSVFLSIDVEVYARGRGQEVLEVGLA